jgi:hypothetical protein
MLVEDEDGRGGQREKSRVRKRRKKTRKLRSLPTMEVEEAFVVGPR